MNTPITILFLCTGNSCRSQMAEGLARHFKADQVRPVSAGIKKHGLNPLAVKVMMEVGIDISSQQSKTLAEIDLTEIDCVITVCSHAHETCPVFPGTAKVVHRGFDDPPYLARDAACEAEALPHYRRVRDELRAYIETLPGAVER